MGFHSHRSKHLAKEDTKHFVQKSQAANLMGPISTIRPIHNMICFSTLLPPSNFASKSSLTPNQEKNDNVQNSHGLYDLYGLDAQLNHSVQFPKPFQAAHGFSELARRSYGLHNATRLNVAPIHNDI